MKFEFVLSLIIPTYNRKEELPVSIKTLVGSLTDCSLKNKIEIVILDNHSSYNIEDSLKETINDYKNNVSIRLIKNESNIGNDKNFLKGLCHAKGKYILLCSDRYYYNIDFLRLVHALEERNPQCLIFSDRFRKYSETEVSISNSYKDEWLSSEFDFLNITNDYFEVNTNELLNSNYIKNGLINSFSDVVLYNQGENYFLKKLSKFTKSHMLGVAAQLDSLSISNKLLIFRVDYNSIVHQNIGRGNLYNRHDYNEVYHGNVLLQKNYDFIGSENEIKLLQLRGLIELYLKIKAGLYFALINPDLNLIKSIVSHNSFEFSLNDKINLFLIKSGAHSTFIRSYFRFKRSYFFLRDINCQYKSDRLLVKEIREQHVDK